MHPPTFWNRSIVMKNVNNPAIVLWMNRTLIASREGKRLRFSLLVESLNENNKDSSNVQWLLPDDYPIPLFDNIGAIDQTQEDARFLILHSNMLLVTYAMYSSLHFGISSQCYALLQWNSTTNSISVHKQHILLIQGTAEGGLSQKNWTPFEHRKSIHFVVSFSPLHIVALTGEYAMDGTRQIVRTIVHSPEARLPWLGSEFGSFISGGSPAIHLSAHLLSGIVGNDISSEQKEGLFLTIFHTFTTVYGRRVYFFGAITFCPSFPYFVHSMSAAPIILQKSLYEGPWIEHPTLSYVLFPQAVFLHPSPNPNPSHHHRESGQGGEGDGEGGEGDGRGDGVQKDRRWLWIGFGHQNKDAVLTKVDLGLLLANLTWVRDCVPFP